MIRTAPSILKYFTDNKMDYRPDLGKAHAKEAMADHLFVVNYTLNNGQNKYQIILAENHKDAIQKWNQHLKDNHLYVYRSEIKPIIS